MTEALLDRALSGSASRTPAAVIERIVLEEYGFRPSVEALSSEREEIFRLHHDGRRFILRLSHALESAEVTDLQTQALLHLERTAPELPTPRVIPTRDGRLTLPAPWAVAGMPNLRLMSYLEGRPLTDAPRGTGQSHRLGAVLARLGMALRDFNHAADGRDLDWDLRQAGRLEPLLQSIDDQDSRALAEHWLSRFHAEVAPSFARLRAQVIHNDFNPHNVLVAAGDAGRVTGIIDFGDIVRTALVNDVAIGASYLVILGSEALDLPLAFVAGYHDVCPLTTEELRLLYGLMGSRLLMTVAITEWRARRHPENRVYIQKNTAGAWAGLRRLRGLDPQWACDQFVAIAERDAAGIAARAAAGRML